MPTELSFLTALLAGFLGSGHCIGMCGGITGALSSALPTTVRASRRGLLTYLLAYNAGRLSTYVLLGAVLGFAGAQLGGLVSPERLLVVGRVVSGIFMILFGLYITGWWPVLTRLERLGQGVWRHLEPFGRRFLPPRRPRHALGLGMVWGFLPCGLVYSALAWSLVGGSSWQGALIMFGFGLGTLPMLLSLGAATHGLQRVSRIPWVRQLAGSLILVLGLYLLAMPAAHDHAALQSSDHVHH